MSIRSRFRLDAVKTFFGGGAEITLSAMYDDKIPEDMRFMKATPSGSFTQRIDNPAALKEFQNEDGSWKYGEYFYVDVSLAGPYPAS